ncbi:MAG: serine/threonine-protein phosphatase [Deltaproteobacteria bacterium]|nr:serine/threonine-protein phosphatase [Deltaproteobacteria bacterium]
MFDGRSSVKGLVNDRSDLQIPAAITDVGCERDLNEDRYAAIESRAGRAWVVCDGMGGVMGGELAAQLAIDAIRRGLETREYASRKEALVSAIEEANRVIVLRRQNPAFSAMGTTIVGLLVKDNEAVIAHAGDSRAYLVRDNSIQQLTIDHTYVQDLVDKGLLDEDDALSHPQAHVLTRCLGAEPHLDLATQVYWIWDVEDGAPTDSLVLCSDGLYSLVSDNEIAEVVSQTSPQESCVRLVELAKKRGGYDNITISILPLEGQLREESPGKFRNGKDRTSDRRRATKKSTLPQLSMGKKIVLILLLAFLGSMVAVLGVLLQL